MIWLAAAGCGGQEIAPPPVDPVGTIQTYAGTGIAGENGTQLRTSARLNLPMDVHVDGASGDVYVVDFGNHEIRVVRAGTDTLRTIVGTHLIGSDTNLVALNHPSGVLPFADGTLLLAAFHNHQVRHAAVGGAQSILWGGAVAGYAGDGGPASAALFRLPASLVVGADSVVYVGDQGNRVIRAVRPDHAAFGDRTIVTFAGTGVAGFAGDGGPARDALFDLPGETNPTPALRLALSTDGRFLFVSDSYNHRIRRIDLASAGDTVTTVAGSGATGSGNGAYAGDGGAASAARLNFPTDVAVDADGSLYICDNANSAIRRVDPSGVITTVAGKGAPGFSGDGGPATAATLNFPSGIALDTARRRLYIADTGNQRIRVVTLAPLPGAAR